MVELKDLVVLDLANNHQGSVEHGLLCIDQFADVATQFPDFRFAIKFQFRDLKTFIQKKHELASSNKHVDRFRSTELSWDEYRLLRNRVREHGLLAMCTPFDEESVNRISEMDFDIVKIASCSATDWPLIEKVCSVDLPIICSTGGLIVGQIDELVSFFRHRGKNFALMHCVALYPTPDEECHLNNIRGLRVRYRDVTIGWSTHEPPESFLHVGLAYSVGARIFERHVGVKTEDVALNAYSSTPEQIRSWLTTLCAAKSILGFEDRGNPSNAEVASLQSLSRGTFATRAIRAGEVLTEDDYYFAFPLEEGTTPAGQVDIGSKSLKCASKDEGLVLERTYTDVERSIRVLKHAVHEVKALINYAAISLPECFEIEFSHHHGVLNFKEVGTTMITLVNRAYCKKLLIQLAGQTHPSHYHREKEETFIVIWGELDVVIDGRQKRLVPGDSYLVMPGVWHQFSTDIGCVFEEISTTYAIGDSVYADNAINHLSSLQRKTICDHWGRFELVAQLIQKEQGSPH